MPTSFISFSMHLLHVSRGLPLPLGALRTPLKSLSCNTILALPQCMSNPLLSTSAYFRLYWYLSSSFPQLFISYFIRLCPSTASCRPADRVRFPLISPLNCSAPCHAFVLRNLVSPSSYRSCLDLFPFLACHSVTVWTHLLSCVLGTWLAHFHYQTEPE